MTLKQLEAFYWAATCNSFAMAAERVHLSVSSLSKRIAELEASLGQVLFDRGRHRAALTDAGTRLLPLAAALLQQADRLQQEMGSSTGLWIALYTAATQYAAPRSLDSTGRRSRSPRLHYSRRHALCGHGDEGPRWDP